MKIEFSQMTDYVNWKFAVAWIIAVIILYLMALAVVTAYFSIAIALLYILKVIPKILFLAIVGYTTINLAAIMKLSDEEREKLAKLRDKTIVLISVVVMNIDFILASIVGNWIYAVTSAGLLIPLLWFSVESWMINRNLWYLTPVGLIARVLIIPLKTKVTPIYFLPAGILPLTGKVQRRLA